jgi:hypothetical protein
MWMKKKIQMKILQQIFLKPMKIENTYSIVWTVDGLKWIGFIDFGQMIMTWENAYTEYSSYGKDNPFLILFKDGQWHYFLGESGQTSIKFEQNLSSTIEEAYKDWIVLNEL